MQHERHKMGALILAAVAAAVVLNQARSLGRCIATSIVPAALRHACCRTTFRHWPAQRVTLKSTY